jgi:hypothetical protein
MPSHKSSPRRAANATRAEVDAGQADHRKRTSRFVQAHPYTREQIETAIATATCAQLVAALDLSIGLPDTACDCPKCGSLRSVYALGRNHWRCETCGQLGSWLALRQPVAMSVEACVRLARLVHREKAAGDAA